MFLRPTNTDHHREPVVPLRGAMDWELSCLSVWNKLDCLSLQSTRCTLSKLCLASADGWHSSQNARPSLLSHGTIGRRANASDLRCHAVEFDMPEETEARARSFVSFGNILQEIRQEYLRIRHNAFERRPGVENIQPSNALPANQRHPKRREHRFRWNSRRGLTSRPLRQQLRTRLLPPSRFRRRVPRPTERGRTVKLSRPARRLALGLFGEWLRIKVQPARPSFFARSCI